MSRTRNLKPGFFRNEELGRLSPWHRLLFAGLPQEADREGRLEDRPLKLKGALFPYDPHTEEQIDAWLDDLDREGFIKRYAHPDYPYPLIQIINFKKYNTPHKKEPASCIPEHLEEKKTRKVRDKAGSVRGSTGASPGNSGPSRAGVSGVSGGSGGSGEISPSASAAQPAPPVRLDRWMHEQWIAAGHQGGWTKKEWASVNAGIRLCGSEHRARESWLAYLQDPTPFHAGHYPSKWAMGPAAWPRKATQALPKRTAQNMAAGEGFLEVKQREREQRAQAGGNPGGHGGGAEGRAAINAGASAVGPDPGRHSD